MGPRRSTAMTFDINSAIDELLPWTYAAQNEPLQNVA
jgi:hypothetical protein